MRRMLSAVGANEGIELLLLNRLSKSDSNAEFLAALTKGAEGQGGGAKGS
jgi:transcription termination factor Rho